MALSQAKNFKNFISFWFCDVNRAIHIRLSFLFQLYSLFVICCWCLLHFITSQLTLTFIRMPTCQAYKGTNTTGKTTKGKNFFKTPELKNATERKRAQQWLHLIEEHVLDSICRTLCSYSHKTCSSYRYIMLCYPA